MSKEKNYKVDALQASVLLFHLYRSPDTELDADRTLHELSQGLKEAYVMVPKSVLESALYSCNMLNEKRRFWHPNDKSFDTFVKGFLDENEVFDSFYHLIGPKDGKH